MERRLFLRTGLAAGLLTSAGGVLPSRSVAAALRPRPANGPLRLNANENPLGLAPVARAAVIDGMADANRYPFAGIEPVVRGLSERFDLDPAGIFLGAGSTEILQMAVQLFGQHGATFIIGDPTFEDVPGYAEPWNIPTVKVPLRADYSHDLPAMRKVAESTFGASVVYVCNPNNPTGTLTSCTELDEWIGGAPADTYFLVDEAYYEYATDHPDYWSATKWIDSNPNVIVARTFSKIFGMAGMRLGYGMAHPDTAAKVKRLAADNSCNHLALVAASASMGDGDLVPRSVAANAAAKRVMYHVLDELGIAYLPSHTNFLMHQIKGDLATYIKRMGDAGIAVGRPFPPMLDYNRVSVATADEMQTWANALREFRSRGWV